MKKIIKKGLSTLLALAILLGCSPFIEVIPLMESKANQAPEYSVGDIITFGEYPQSAVTDPILVSSLNKILPIKVSGDDILYYNKTKYMKMNSMWYVCEPISWDIMYIENGKYFVQSKKVLDCQSYNVSGSSSNWYYSSINQWLNTTFYNRAFSNIEKNAINDYSIENNLCKVFIISYSDACNPKYGYSSNPTADDSRRIAHSTMYAQNQGAGSGSSNWMLRDYGTINSIRYSLAGDGCVGSCHGTVSVTTKLGIRPAMIINYGKQTHTVPDYKTQNKNYADQYFFGNGLALDGSGTTPDMCIPNLLSSYDMIPQGIAYYPAKNWILISAYYKGSITKMCKAGKLFALDMNTGGLVAEYTLKTTNGSDYIGHAGGIAVSENNLYITNTGSSIAYIPLSSLTEDATELQLSGSVSLSNALNNTNASYLTLSDGVLWVGNCYEPKEDGCKKKYSESNPSVIVGYILSGSNSTEEWNSIANHSYASYTINVPKELKDIQSAMVKDGYLIMVSSYGRGNDSKVYTTRIDASCQVNKYETCLGIPMMEGFCIVDDYMYFITESGAYYYYGYDKSNMAKNPSDVVWRLDYKSLLGENKYPSTAGDINLFQVIFNDDGNEGSTLINFKQSWFSKDSAIYNHELGKLASQFAMIGYGKTQELRNALAGLGMNNIEINLSTAEEEVNYFIASKTIKVNGVDNTFIFTGFIGSHKEQWYSNFNPGTDNTHQGFNNAKNYVYTKLQKYISSIGADTTATKILITGHSRGAATANLVAAELIKAPDYIAKENIYTYTFATPNSTTLAERTDTKFKRIFNIVNPEDFVTKCMPTAWGYGRYGTTLTLPSKTNSTNYKTYLNNMRVYFSEFYGGKTYKPFLTGEAATYNVISSLTSSVKNINQFETSEFLWLGTKQTIFDYFQKTLCPFVAEDDGSSKKIAAIALFLATAAADTDVRTTLLNSKLISDVTNFFIVNEGIGNISGDIVLDRYFTCAHCAQTYCAYMMSLSETQVQIYRSGLHNSVNCPVDVEIIDKTTGEVVGKIVNNVIDEEIAAKDNAVVITVDGDSKQFWLPSDGYYDVVLTGNDDGKMDYTISEIDADVGEIKRSNFFDTEIINGGSMTGMPEVEEGSLNDYELDLSETESLSSTAIIDTEDLGNIEINTASYGKGFATESLNITSGDYITLTALEDEEAEFFGWYENDVLVSNSSTYSFVAKDTVNIYAEFTRDVGDSNGDNIVNSLDALRVLKYSTEIIDFNSFEVNITDVNSDGDIDSLDALMILQYSVGVVTEFESIEE